VRGASVTMAEAVRRTQAIIAAARTVRKDLLFLSHGGPISRPQDAAYINAHTDAVGFVGASSLERLAIEDSLTELTRRFKHIPAPAARAVAATAKGGGQSKSGGKRGAKF
jgi:predicted TIM-barrel enzyme